MGMRGAWKKGFHEIPKLGRIKRAITAFNERQRETGELKREILENHDL